MSFRITIEPSGHTFLTEINEPLLDAALRSGMNLSYHCNIGNCGDCKIKVKQGKYEIIQKADFVLAESEKAQGYALLCSISATSDMAIEAAEARHASDIPFQSIETKFVKFALMKDEYFELHLRTPRSNTLRFLAGQLVHLRIGDLPAKALAIASCPCNGMNLQFHLYRGDADPFVQYFFNHSKLSEKIKLEGPFGEFTLNDDSHRASVFIAYGLGFAPIKSLVEHALALEKEQSMILFWIMPDNLAHYQANYCRAWEDAFDGFVYFPILLDSSQAGMESLPIALSSILSRCPVESEIDLYLAGPDLMVDMYKDAFIKRDTPKENIYVYRLKDEEVVKG